MGVVAVVDALQRLGGTAPAAHLVHLCGRHALAQAVASGEVVRPRRGHYALATLPDPWAAALRRKGVVSHASAARHWGLEVMSDPGVHVTVRRRRYGVDAHGVVLHWADLRPDDVDDTAPVTLPLRTVLDCARTLPFDQALAVADSALRSGQVGLGELQAAADGLRGAGRQRIGSVVRHADGRAESGLESCLRAIFIQAGIRGFEPQVQIRDEEFRARVDLADERRRIVAEADSFAHHGYRQALVRDCERYDELVARGWLVVRFAWEQVMFRPSWVAAVTSSVVGMASRRPVGGQKSASGSHVGAGSQFGPLVGG